MFRKFLLVYFVFLGSTSCFAQKQSVTIEGELTGYLDGFIVKLYDLSSGTNVLMDSTELNKGKFKFKKELPEGYQYVAIMDIRKSKKGVSLDYKKFWVEPGTVHFKGKLGDLRNAEVKGSKINDEEQEYFRMLEKDSDDEFNVLKKFINKYPKSIIAIKFLDTHAQQMNKDSLQQYFDYFDLELKNSAFGQNILAALKHGTVLNIGDQATDFKLPNKDGKVISLSDYKGKYVLLDFWGSWCIPCREENKNLVKIHQTYQHKGFDILGVSIEGNRNHWLSAMKEDKITWESLSDLKGDKTIPVHLYAVTKYPSNFLINPEGIIIAKDLRGVDLVDKLKELIK